MIRDEVQALLDTAVATGVESAAQVAVVVDGVVVTDAVAGPTGGGREVTPDHLFFAASTAKGIAATVAHALVDRGLLADDLRLVEVWPELAGGARDRITLVHVLGHTAGLPAPPYGTTVAELCDWDHMCASLAGATPWWEPGTRFGYHPLTFGFLLGETVRRATGRPLSWWLRELVTAPLGLEDQVYFGVPYAELDRVVPQVAVGLPGVPVAGSPADRALPPGVRPDAAYANDPAVLAADIPSQGTMTARGAARLYAALAGHGDGIELVGPERRALLCRPSFVGHDVVMGVETAWAHGFSPHPPPGRPHEDRTVLGMYGVNGSGAYADLGRGVAVAVMRNRFDPDTRLLAEVDRIVTDSLAADSLAADSLTADPLGTDPLGTDSLGTDSLGTDSLGTDSLGTDSLGTDPLGTDPLSTDSLSTRHLTADPLATERDWRSHA